MMSKKQLRRILLGLAIIVPSALLLTFALEQYRLVSARISFGDYPLPPHSVDAAASPNGMLDTPAIMGQVGPSGMVPIVAIQLDDDKQVVAVQIGDQQLAYPLDFMAGQGAHISNECFDSTPITVAYCDQTDVVRVLTSADNDTPLEISQNGMLNGELALRFKDQAYQLSLDTIPLANHPYKRMSWREWKAMHPEGRVYSGVDWEKVEADQPDSI
jgi:hypothetical protein